MNFNEINISFILPFNKEIKLFFMFKNYTNQLFVDKFSILSQYANLSLFNYEKMKLILSTWQHQFIGNDAYFDAEWSDKNTRIKIRYQTNTGAFIQILEEEWITNKMLFIRSIQKRIK